MSEPKEITGPESDTTSLALRSLDSRVLSNGLPYTVLTPMQRRCIAWNLALISLCTSLGVSIYWVALPELERAFHVSEEKVNLSVTAYLAVQAVAPMFISTLADRVGRRPILLMCMIGGTACNIGISRCNTYWLLIFLRCLIACFLAPIVSVAQAVIGDITTGRNRGSVTGLVTGLGLIGQALAPFIGSLVDTRWHWRSIFYFSAAFDGMVFVISFFLMPETKRSIAGNMSHTPERWIHRAPILAIYTDSLTDKLGTSLESPSSLRYNPLEPLLLLEDKSILLTLIPCAIIYTTWTMAQASLTTSLSRYYHYSSLKIGLCYFAPGIATTVGTFTSGRMLDHTYKRYKRKYAEKYAHKTDRPPFNVVQARVSAFAYGAVIVIAGTLIYGWCLKFRVSVAPVIIGAFLISLGAVHPMNIAATLMVDLHPEAAGSAVALYNIFRCGSAAIFVSCLSRMNSAMTLGGTYTLMAGLAVMATLLIYSLMFKKPR